MLAACPKDCTMTYFWFRRDLRLHDNAALYYALKNTKDVQCVFIFDQNILEKLPSTDARVTFLHDTVSSLKDQLIELGSDLVVYHGRPLDIWSKLLSNKDVVGLYCNRDYEPYAQQRDEEVKKLCDKYQIDFCTYKDHVIFEKDEVTKDDGLPYTVFTPYKRKWLAKLTQREDSGLSYYFKAYPNEKYFGQLSKVKKLSSMPSHESLGFDRSEIEIPSTTVTQKVIREYDKKRNFPAVNGTSKLGIHFRFGTISIRDKARKAQKLNDTFLSELVWRDFYSQILYHFPHVANKEFRAKYEGIPWRFDEEEWTRWKEGRTGYPMVDAGMRELNNTGYMHNRVRMVVASFLTKHMLHDWRLGEAYFAEKLLDFDLASNNGGWQWASGSGTDAAPYFRIFNPTSQMTKFDPQKEYIKKWIPEFGTDQYPEPMLDHKEARERCLATYKMHLN